MALNKRLLRKVRNRIEKYPDAYNQSTFGEKGDESSAPCGTVACIAGHTIIAAAPTPQLGVKTLFRKLRDGGVSRYAGKLLGLELGGIDEHLFTGIPNDSDYPWPNAKYALQWGRAKTHKQRTRVAIRYLDHILKTGKVSDTE